MSLRGTSPTPDLLPVGYRLADDYEIIGVLGTGGFANTYLAKDLPLARDIAIKEYFPRDVAHRDANHAVLAGNEQLAETFKWGMDRFVREARVLARFRHPNIVRVYRTLDANRTAYIVLDYVHGQDLDTWLKGLGRRPNQDEMDELLAPLIDALSLVHAANVLHRDIKPANIRIREETGDPVLLDFGASKHAVAEAQGNTRAIISRGYSPYEAYAADSGTQGPWTDIYALGATVYRALSERELPEAAERLLEDEFLPLGEQKLPGFRREFIAAVDWALSVRPNHRPQTVEAWRARLFAGGDATIINWGATRSLTHTPGEVRPPGDRPVSAQGASGGATRAEPEVPGAARKRSGAWAAAAAVVLALAGAGGMLAAVQAGLVGSEWLPTAMQQLRKQPQPEKPGTIEAADGGSTARRPPQPALPAVSPEAQAPAAGLPKAGDSAKPVESAGQPVAVASLEVSKPPAVPPPQPGPEYVVLAYGSGVEAERVVVAAVSSNGRRIAGAGLDGIVRTWSTLTGEESTIGRSGGGAVLALDFVDGEDRAVVAALADGSLVLGDVSAAKLQPIGRASLERGFIRALAFNAGTRDVAVVETSAGETKVSRWPVDGRSSTPSASFLAGNYMARAAALAKNASGVIIATDREALLAYDLRDGSSREGLGWIEAAPDWTSALALTADARIVARGGHYSHVEIFDLDAKVRRAQVLLGEQAQTLALAFSEDGKRLAIDYSVFIDRVARNRIRVVDAADGRSLADIDSPHDRRRWLSFLPSRRNAYWLASTAGGRVRLCETSDACRLAGPVP